MSFGSFVVLAAAATALAATTPATSSALETKRRTAGIAVGSSTYGKILFDDRNRALYAFTRDAKGGRSTCYGACATAWPPYVVPSRPAAGKGARASLIGTVRRRDGRLQAAYGGRPVYFYVGDRRPGEVLCQNVREFGGLWLVLRGSAELVR